MQIYENSREFTKVEIYLMTSSPDVIALKNVDDETSIPIDGYILFKVKTRMAKKLIFSHLSHQTKKYTLVSLRRLSVHFLKSLN